MTSLLFQSSQGRALFLALLFHQLRLCAAAVGIGILAGVPLGILTNRCRRLGGPVATAVNLVQALPSLAVLGLLFPLAGLGDGPAVGMVVLYALLPVVKQTAAGLDGIAPETLEAARGMGIPPLQILLRVQLPLALPVIAAGVRSSAVTAVGLATLASYIQTDGLGTLLQAGFQQGDASLVLAGAVPACLLALAAYLLLGKVEKAVVPVNLQPGAALPATREEMLQGRRRQKAVFIAIAAAAAALLLLLALGHLAVFGG